MRKNSGSTGKRKKSPPVPACADRNEPLPGCCQSASRRRFIARLGMAGGAALAFGTAGASMPSGQAKAGFSDDIRPVSPSGDATGIKSSLSGASASNTSGTSTFGSAPSLRDSIREIGGLPPIPGFGGKKPVICVGFVRSAPGEYLETGWPGRGYGSDASQALYTSTLEAAAGRLGVDLHVWHDRLGNDGKVDAFLDGAIKKEAEGVILVNMEAQTYGMQGLYRILEKRGSRELPVLGFIPHGTLHSHPDKYDPFRNGRHCFLAGSSDIAWLAEGLRILKARWLMANTRLAVVTGDIPREEVLGAPLRTTLCYVPMKRYLEIEKATEGAVEAPAIAALYREKAGGIFEPDDRELLQAARAYIANRRLLAEAGCHGVATNCFLPVTNEQMFPPCLAFMQLLDEGSAGVCEADVYPGLTQLLSRYLLDKPGFLHNPIFDTTRNLYAGGHCTAPSHMAGFNEVPDTYILRSHHEAGFGAVPQVLFREGQPATLWRFLSPGSLMIATGTILHNIDTHTDDGVGGCRTSFIMEMDGIKDVRDIRGHHKILTYGKHLHTVKAWAALSGVEVECLTGAAV
jgi:hypothetical protein